MKSKLKDLKEKLFLNKYYQRFKNSKIGKKVTIPENKFIINMYIYKIILDIIYIFVLAKYFKYNGFLFEFSIIKYLISFLLIYVIGKYAYKVIEKSDKIRLSSIVIIIWVAILLVPFISMISFYPFSFGFILAFIIYWYILFFLYKKYLEKVNIKTIGKKYLSINYKKIQYIVLLLIYVLSALIVVYIWAYYADFRITINIFDVYGIRTEASSYNISILLNYLYFMTKIIFVIFMLYFLNKKNICFLLLHSFCKLLIFQ